MGYIITTVLLMIYQITDYELQANEHSWPSLLTHPANKWWSMKFRAAKWGLFDFMPHDCWHIIQLARNWSVIASALIVQPTWISVGIYIVIYAVTRFIGFTIPRKILQGY